MRRTFSLAQVLASLAPFSESSSDEAVEILKATLDWSSYKVSRLGNNPVKKHGNLYNGYYSAARSYILSHLLSDPQRQIHVCLSKNLGMRGRQGSYLIKLGKWKRANPEMAQEPVLTRKIKYTPPMAPI